MAGGLTGTGMYVSYADWTRFRRMMTKYATGNILPPMAENTYETVYFQRPKLEQVGQLHTGQLRILTNIYNKISPGTRSGYPAVITRPDPGSCRIRVFNI